MQIDCDPHLITEINFESPFSKQKKFKPLPPSPSPVILLSSKVELIADNCFVAIKTVTVQDMGSCSGRTPRKKYSGASYFENGGFDIVSV